VDDALERWATVHPDAPDWFRQLVADGLAHLTPDGTVVGVTQLGKSTVIYERIADHLAKHS
jgi:hypothetical protein